MTLSRKSNSHRIVIEFDDGAYVKKLIHPEGGCVPATICAGCGRDVTDPESHGREGCYDCKEGIVGDTECWVQGWVDDAGTELLQGEFEVEIDPEWDRDRCILHIVKAAEVSR